MPVLGFLALCWWRSVEVDEVFIALAAGALGALVLYALGPPLRALVPLIPGFAPFNAALVYAALPEEALKLAALRAVAARRVPLVAATGVACGFAAAENVLALAYAADPSGTLLERLAIAWPAHLSLAALAVEVLARQGLGLRGYGLAFLVVMPLHTLFDTLFFAGWVEAGMAIIATSFLVALGVWRHRASGAAASI